MKIKIWSILRVVLILFLSTILSFAFEQLDFRRENILLIYVVASLLIMIETKRFLYGLAATICMVFIFNFFFTEPKYTLIIDDPNYIITLVIFIVVSFVVSTLTSKLHKEVRISKENEKRVSQLYQASKILLNATSVEEIALKEMLYLEGIFLCPMSLVLRYAEKNEVFSNHVGLKMDLFEKAIDYAISFEETCGKDQSNFSSIDALIIPMKVKNHISGALIIHTKKVFDQKAVAFLKANVMHMLVALEKEIYAQEEEQAKVAMEQEKFRSALLRSLSHDLRTPLTTIQTGSSILLDDADKLDEETKKSMLLDMNNETSRLSDFVNNLLHMTRVHAEKLQIIKKAELVEDILSDVYNRVFRRMGNHTLQIQEAEELVYVYTDAKLLIQIVTNLIDNALIHTKDKTNICISYQNRSMDVLFCVEDDGGGIPASDLDKIFQDFVSVGYHKQDQNRGMGLGLSISKALVEAHGGFIRAFNNSLGGATFEFSIPHESKEQKDV